MKTRRFPTDPDLTLVIFYQIRGLKKSSRQDESIANEQEWKFSGDKERFLFVILLRLQIFKRIVRGTANAWRMQAFLNAIDDHATATMFSRRITRERDRR